MSVTYKLELDPDWMHSLRRSNTIFGATVKVANRFNCELSSCMIGHTIHYYFECSEEDYLMFRLAHPTAVKYVKCKTFTCDTV